MRTIFSSKDIIKILSTHLFEGMLKDVKGADVEVGILNGEIVAVVAVDEPQLTLQSVADLLEPKTSGASIGSVGKAPEAVALSDEEEEEEEEDDSPTDSKPKKRKRRTKAEIEADNAAAAEAAAAQAENAEASTDPAQASDETSEAGQPPFDIDEAAVVRAEADVLPDATSEVASEDPFAELGGVATEGDNLFDQGNVPVTPVTETSEAGFTKPTEAEDPFATFN